ncbi:MAG: TRAP transporter fused permease subunit [Candidatus Methanomethylicia archaeon]
MGSCMGSTHSKINKIISIFFFAACLTYLMFSVHYFATGFGGEELLAITLVPIAFIIYVLDRLKRNALYPRLGFKANLVIASILVSLCIYISIYMRTEYIPMLYRAGAFNVMDKILALIIFILMMEFMRREHLILFFLNIALVIYCVYGYVFPGILYVPGISWSRVVESSTLEIKLGVFGTYAQLGVSILAAFLLLQGFAAGFGVQDSIVRTIVYTFGRYRRLVPQSAVVSSMAVAMVSGSGSANVAITGQFTIPLMKRYGFHPRYAGATEASASLGGLIMPPVMAAAAFLMADFIGVSYWQVVVRGFAPAIVYYVTIALSVYLVAIRYVGKSNGGGDESFTLPKPSRSDAINTLIFFACIVILCYLMGVLWMAAEAAAFNTVTVFLVSTLIIQIIFTKPKPLTIASWFRNSVESFGKITMELLLLLASLGILINLFTVSGWIMKLGMMLMTIGGENILYLIAIAFALGIFLGLGLPPSATYLLAAVIIAPVMVRLGFNPWVAHFYAFFLGIISEYTPPTSLTAAVASRISGAGFMETMFETLRLSLPVFLLTFAIFKWSYLVVEPGLMQLYSLGVVATGCIGSACSFYAKYSKNRVLDILLRSVSMLLALIILFHPDPTYTSISIPISIPIIVLGIYRTRKMY